MYRHLFMLRLQKKALSKVPLMLILGIKHDSNNTLYTIIELQIYRSFIDGKYMNVCYEKK